MAFQNDAFNTMLDKVYLYDFMKLLFYISLLILLEFARFSNDLHLTIFNSIFNFLYNSMYVLFFYIYINR